MLTALFHEVIASDILQELVVLKSFDDHVFHRMLSKIVRMLVWSSGFKMKHVCYHQIVMLGRHGNGNMEMEAMQ